MYYSIHVQHSKTETHTYELKQCEVNRVMKPNQKIDQTCELLKWLGNYRMPHNTSMQREYPRVSIFLLIPDQNQCCSRQSEKQRRRWIQSVQQLQQHWAENQLEWTCVTDFISSACHRRYCSLFSRRQLLTRLNFIGWQSRLIFQMNRQPNAWFNWMDDDCLFVYVFDF